MAPAASGRVDRAGPTSTPSTPRDATAHPAHEWVRSREHFRPRRTAGQRLLHAGGLIVGLGLLAWIPMQFGPQKTVAQPVPQQENRGRLLGTLVGMRYFVEVRASDRGPLYTIRQRQGGRTVARDLPADDVYRVVPDLDVSALHVGPDDELGRPLMMVPTDTERP